MDDAATAVDLPADSTNRDASPDLGRARPVSPSWLNLVSAWIAGLPVPAWIVYVGFTAFAIVMSNAQNWIAGTISPPQLTIEQTYWALLAGVLLAMLPYLDRVAVAALETFRPALAGANVDFDRLATELTVIPARQAWIVTALAIGATVLGFASSPAATGIVGLPPLAIILQSMGESLVLSLLFLLMYHTLRQLRAVARIHSMAPQVDLFRPAPLYAFSQLTVRTSIAFVAIVSATLLVTGSSVESYPVVVTGPFLVGGLLIATAAFVLPLQGMHGRIVAEKRGLEWQIGRRLESMMGEVHRAADDGDLSRADGLNKLLGSLIAERELVFRLPTWPWQPGTVGAFATAIILPIALFLVTRLLQRLV